MDLQIRTITKKSDWQGVTDVFNFFVEHDMAAYPDQTFTAKEFARQYKQYSAYPFLVIEHQEQVIGFGFLSPLRALPTMQHSALIGYFILPEFTGKGLGSRLLERLIEQGKKIGISNYLAHISSHNQGSIHFHETHGFKHCGCFEKVGRKFGREFDMVWMQRIIS